MEPKRLYKSTQDKAIFGVCGGLAEYFGIDSIIVRLVVVLFTLAFGSGLIFYIIAAIIMPRRPEPGTYCEQPAQPGAYNAGGTVYVNRASQTAGAAQSQQAQQYVYAERMPEEVTRAAAPVQSAPQRSAEPKEAPKPEEPAEPLSEVEKAWKAEHASQLRRTGQQPEEKPAAAKETPKAQAEAPEAAPEAPKAQQVYQQAAQQTQRTQQSYQAPPQQTQRTYQAPQSAQGSGEHARLVLGVVLILIGVFALIRVFLPRFDVRILFAILVIVLGGLLIAKKN